MRNLWVSSLAWALLAASVVGQSTVISSTEVSWANSYNVGTPVLTATVHYPAVAAVPNAAIQPTTTGYPVVVFLHGWGRLGSEYTRLGHELAKLGIVAIMLNTAQFNYTAMESDARAMFGAIVLANVQVGGFFEGKLDARRVGLLGHSMGAAVIAYVLNEAATATSTNPGYKCGLGLAPVNPAIAVAGTMVHVPIGLVSGQGDMLTPPATHAIPYYQSLVPLDGLKFHYQMNSACTHMNLVGLETIPSEVFSRTKKVVQGFFGQFLSGNVLGLEAVLGVDGLSDPNLVQVDMDAVVPQTWASSSLRVGATTRISVAAEAGFAGLIVADSMGLPTLTFIGTLLLDPATAFSIAETFIVGERLDVLITVPLVPQLIGTSFAVQGAGATIDSVFKLGSALSFTIGS